MSDVIQFPKRLNAKKKIDKGDHEAAVRGIMERNPREFLGLGWDKEGDLLFVHSGQTIADALYLLDAAKKAILDGYVSE